MLVIVTILWTALTGSAPALAGSRASVWKPITSSSQPSCTTRRPCALEEKGARMHVTFETAVVDGRKVLRRVIIENRRKNLTQKFPVPELNSEDIDDEKYELMKVSLGVPQGEGFALHAYNSAREGETYYYFLFDPAAQTYKMTEGTLPKVVFSPQSKSLRTAYQERPIRLEGYRLSLVPEAIVQSAMK